jgi:hypothetical protein
MNGKIFSHNPGLRTQAGTVPQVVPQPDSGEVAVSWRKDRAGVFLLSIEFRRSSQAAPFATTMAITGSGSLFFCWPDRVSEEPT